MADSVPQEPEAEDEERSAGWLATFADLMSLLLTFFVLLLSFAQMDIVKFRDAAGSLKNAFGYADSTEGPFSTKSSSLIEYQYIKKESNLQMPMEMKFDKVEKKTSEEGTKKNHNQEILQRIEESIDWNDLGEMVEAEATGKGVVVKIKGKLLYGAGSSTLKDGSKPLLDDIINVIEEFPYNVNIEGHTDNKPINTPRFPSNWELSSARAIEALKYILASGRIESERLGAVGYADTRPLVSNKTREGRETNRRVEFIFYENILRETPE